jgi:glc operon protein GlcG
MDFFKSVVIAMIFSAISATTQAQVVDKKALTLDGAKKVIAAAVAEAKKNNSGGVIAVVDDGGNLMALERLDGTFAAGANISIGKARTAAIFKRPTSAFEDIIKNGRTAMVALSDFTPLQGGVPIIFDEQVVGAIGVSGATSAQEDTAIAIAGANALTSQTATVSSSSDSNVTYIESKKVAEGFSKGAVLVDNGEYTMHSARNYMVHTSRREKPGMAEIHTLDTDIIYVVDGSATIITGGTAVDTKAIAPNEIRGKAIQGGESRRLNKGDIIIIPNGVPHWFKEVNSLFLYYVVKVR